MWDIDEINAALEWLADETHGMYVIAYARDKGDGKWETAVGARGNHAQLACLISVLIEKVEARYK